MALETEMKIAPTVSQTELVRVLVAELCACGSLAELVATADRVMAVGKRIDLSDDEWGALCDAHAAAIDKFN
jgi:hypothetical protein